MRIHSQSSPPTAPPLHFSYCMNVHPGESAADIQAALLDHVPPIRQALSPHQPFGLGLRLARAAVTDLQSPQTLAAFRRQLLDQNLYAFTVNAFPYGAFHQTRVKENVYTPDWRSPDRLHYTREAADILAALLPEGIHGSLSTVPLTYGPWTRDRADRAAMRRHFADLTLHLAHLEQETGKLLHIGLEPEPDCALETTPQTIDWFRNELFFSGAAELAERGNLPSQRAEALLRRHIGVCFDTCHVAMQFEDPADSMRLLTREGIRISKVQLSAALECDSRDIPPEALRPFDEGVYLHQVKSSRRHAWPDLPDWFASPDPDAGTLRIHCHVPLHWTGDGPLRSTRHTLTPAFRDALLDSGCDHLEVETYTFNVLPDNVRTGTLAEDMIAECRWVLDTLPLP